MDPKVYIPQPIPDVALTRLKTMADVEVFPHLDRVISPEELLKAVKGKNYLLCPWGNSLPREGHRCRAPRFEGDRRHVYLSKIR